jgi:hypothetical protein
LRRIRRPSVCTSMAANLNHVAAPTTPDEMFRTEIVELPHG